MGPFLLMQKAVCRSADSFFVIFYAKSGKLFTTAAQRGGWSQRRRWRIKRRHVKKICRWHIFSVDLGGCAAVASVRIYDALRTSLRNAAAKFWVPQQDKSASPRRAKLPLFGATDCRVGLCPPRNDRGCASPRPCSKNAFQPKRDACLAADDSFIRVTTASLGAVKGTGYSI